MPYFITFLEGIITFVSPCLLPLLPVYISYFSGGDGRSAGRTLLAACGFVCGFSLVFLALGTAAGTLGSALARHQTLVNLLCGAIVIGFGLSYLGLFSLPTMQKAQRAVDLSDPGFFSSLLFGVVFSVEWTPCVGTFLGSALALASQQGSARQGFWMLIAYSAGLGIPFLLSALLIDRLKGSFQWIKAHYAVLNRAAGVFLILVGILMATGTIGVLLRILN